MTDDEFDALVKVLDRRPEPAELAMFSVMWSEHCSYKSSRTHLAKLPSDAPWVVVGPGENAGVVDLGDGWLAALRIESHNHPSFVEPYQGAATGVGGILRDIFSMGARPVALWNQIRFGNLDDNHSRYLFDRVVSGIAGYGNAVGVPTLGGELAFDDTYRRNPLVNVMAVGLMNGDELIRAQAGNSGTVAILLGSSTGRDGIGGASVLASSSLGDDSATKRPSVQVGDPFAEKKLIEACLEMYRAGLVIGIQDLGAAGLTCAFSEPAARSGVGVELDLDEVPVREPDMSASELLLSESQERMLAFVAPERAADVLKVAAKWEIDATVIGGARPGDRLVVNHRGDVVADVPVHSLSDEAPLYQRPLRQPDWMNELRENMPRFEPPDVAESLLVLLDDPSIGDPSWVYTQYDHQLFLNTVVEPGHDASLLRIRGTDKGIAVSTDGNGRLCRLDPREGSAHLVYEAALNVAMTGAMPLALVDNLNFGNPEQPEVMWEFAESVQGIAAACEALTVPVVGGNVSFYNETDSVGIYPTPVVGMLGLADPMPAHPLRLDRAEDGMEIWLFGPDCTNLSGSSFAWVIHRHLGGAPEPTNPHAGRAATRVAVGLAADGIASALHDLSDGGLAVAVAEICIKSGVGAVVAYSDWRDLFAEGPHRFIAALSPEATQRAASWAQLHGLEARRVGQFEGTDLVFIGGNADDGAVSLDHATDVWREAIPRRLNQPAY